MLNNETSIITFDHIIYLLKNQLYNTLFSLVITRKTIVVLLKKVIHLKNLQDLLSLNLGLLSNQMLTNSR